MSLGVALASSSRAFGSDLLKLEEGEAWKTGQALMELATDFYSPMDRGRRELGVELRGLAERLMGLEEGVLRPLSEDLKALRQPGRTVQEFRDSGTRIRELAHDLLELSDRLSALSSEAQSLGPGVRNLVERGAGLARRLAELGTRVSGVGDRLLAMRPEELTFLTSLAPASRAGGAPGWSASSAAAATAHR